MEGDQVRNEIEEWIIADQRRRKRRALLLWLRAMLEARAYVRLYGK